MHNVMIGLDEQSMDDIKFIKRDKPDFNLSEFVRGRLHEFANKGKLPEEERIELEISKDKAEILELQTKLDFKISRLNNLKIEKDNEMREYIEKEDKIKTEENKRINTYKNNIIFLFDVSEEVAKLLANEYYDLNTDMDIPEFMKNKGYIFK